ncbi:OmpL47-type beta-barrel domain-containing protein [Tenuifilum thalassicum]|uniref:Ig-like domain-containing protein n=1 Tax=Tenuifilum thalassicum TaxID=2590900 RepID=A0A7D4BDH6_9BACT|nr:hypothetical protein [Tenuifilum thalassicum]QKG79338.1 hypothetical protein FHG85_03345 [Tenuifilum thalassicum]
MKEISKNIILIFSVVLPFVLSAQENGNKSLFIDSTGNLFVSPDVPVNIYIGTKPDGSNAVLLHDVNRSGKPLKWNGSGPQLMTHLDLYKGRKIRFELYADGIPPKTAINFENQKIRELKDAIIVRGGSIVEFSAVDEQSGVDKIFFSVNSDDFKEYSQPISLTEDGEYEVRTYAVDHLGNKEPVVYRKIIVDATPPTTELTFRGDKYENILSGRSALVLNTSDRFGVAETKIMIDSSGKWNRYIKPIQTSRLSEGEHKISYFSIDNAGNVESSKTYTFYVDKTPPVVVEEIEGNSFMVGNREFSSGRSQLKVLAVDNKAGVKEVYYSLNNGEFRPYEKPVLLSEILGTVKLRTYAVDNVNNRTSSEANAQSFTMPTIDIAGPDISYGFIGPKLTIRDTLWIGSSTLVKINAVDREAGVNRIEYTLNQSEVRTYFEPFTITESGFYNADVSAFDNVENINMASFSFAVDNNPPSIFYNFSSLPIGAKDNLPVYQKGIVLYLAATDNLTVRNSIKYKLNNGKFLNYTSPISRFVSGINELVISTTDGLGNNSTQTIRFYVE